MGPREIFPSSSSTRVASAPASSVRSARSRSTGISGRRAVTHRTNPQHCFRAFGRPHLASGNGGSELLDRAAVEIAGALALGDLAFERARSPWRAVWTTPGLAQAEIVAASTQPKRTTHAAGCSMRLCVCSDGLVLNTNARLLRTRPELVQEIRELSAGRAGIFVTRNLEELERAAAAIAARQTGVKKRDRQVVLCGGDGTLMAGVTALARAFGTAALPDLVLAPAGTVATVARNWGQTRGVLQTVQRAVDGQTRARGRAADLASE